jgi:DNA polymerase zeta
MFVRVPGATKRRAFEIGEQISAAVTAMNPAPVHLKFEKVYFPSVLLTKKRYVGFAYESRAQELPAFDAKGIETVRRDTCPAVAKVMEQSLRTLFVTKDVSAVRRYVQRQFAKIMQDRVSLRDFVFARRCGSARTAPTPCRRPPRSSASSACSAIRAPSRATASACATPSSTGRRMRL